MPNAEVHVLRGGMIESRHRVSAAVVRPDGTLVGSVGDPDLLTFLRSSAKPVQALPLARVMDRYGLEDRHLAVACASHAGEAVHVAAVRELMDRTGVRESDLVCGTHPPFDALARRALAERGETPGVLHHNCSGKHAGMVAAARALGLPADGYARPDHPLQRRIAADLSALAGEPEIAVAVDGCSVPAYALPLRAAALAFARLAAPGSAPEGLAEDLRRVRGAMLAHPYLVAGRERLDTRLMRLLPGAVSKAGAEAFQAMALPDTRHGPLGLALKVEDGGERARDAAAVRALAGLGLLDEAAPGAAGLARTALTNHAGLEVGEVRAAFELEPRA